MADFALVPIHVEALFVPEKKAITGAPGDKNEKLPLKAGVHLHWFLPSALTKGTVEGENTTYPPVPNRWLVTRQNRFGVQKQWVVESDYLHPAGQGEGAVAYPLKSREAASSTYRYLGRNLSLAEWLAPRGEARPKYLDPETGLLTAVGYGVPTFALYYPHCHSVFGFCDEDIKAAFPVDLKYSVIGWYSDPQYDFLKTCLDKEKEKAKAEAKEGEKINPRPAAEVLEMDLGWLLPADLTQAKKAELQLQRMFCGGVVSKPIGDFNPEAKKVAIGNSSEGALAAYLADELAGGQTQQKALMEEQLEFLAAHARLTAEPLDQEARFVESQHESGFDAVYGGSQWVIRPDLPPEAEAASPEKPKPRPEKPKVKLPPELAQLLGELNADQKKYDQTMLAIREMELQSYLDWRIYKQHAQQQPAASQGSLADDEARRFIETHDTQPLEDKRKEHDKQQAEVEKARAALENAIKQHNEQDGAEPYCLKEIPAARFWQPTEPVVLIPGEGEPDFVKTIQGVLDCRIVSGGDADQPITKQTLDGLLKEVSGLPVPKEQPAWPIFLDWVAALLPKRPEGAIVSTSQPLAPASQPVVPASPPNAPASPIVVASVTGSEAAPGGYPEDFITRNFVLAEDKVEFQAQGKPRSEALAFGMMGQPEQPGPGGQPADAKKIYSGSSILAAHAGIPLKQKIAKYLQTLLEKRSAGKEFRDWLDENVEDICAGADLILTCLRAFKTLKREAFLSQALSGFHDLLLQRPVTQYSEADPLGLAAPSAAQPLDELLPIRAGTLELQHLRLVDTFGRIKELSFDKLIVSEKLRDPAAGQNRIALPPRLVQPARLNFRWLAAGAGFQARDEMNAHPAAHPICGWLLPDFLDNSLMVYDQAGLPLGMVSAKADSGWQATPGSPAATVKDIANPHLKKVVEYVAAQAKGSGFLEEFIRPMQDALEHITPERAGRTVGLALLISRPIAVVRASLELQILGGPAVRQAWNAGSQGLERDPQQQGHAFSRVRFPVRLGEKNQLDDGLICYWLEDAQGALKDAWRAAQTSVELTADDPPQVATLLLDPQGKVHATCGILPVKAIDIPPDQYADLLEHLEVSFLAAPLLTDRDGMNLPLPDEAGYGWTWREGREGAWKDINPPASQVAFAAPQVIREVWLKLKPEEDQPGTK